MCGDHFNYDENAEMIDVYVNHIRQVAALLGYEEPQVLEVFKNTILNRLYWILYATDNLRLAAETAKSVLTKEKIDRQMSGQSSTAPFMKVRDGQKSSFKNSSKKRVSFDALETIERNSYSIDKLTSLVNKMNVRMNKHDAQYKPQVYQSRRRGQNRHGYRQNYYQPRSRLYSRNRIDNTSYRGGGSFDRNYR